MKIATTLSSCAVTALLLSACTHPDLDEADTDVEVARAELNTANASTDDKALTTPIGNWFYTGISAAQVGTLLTQNGARLTNVQIDPATNTFTVTMVKNSGVSAVAGWWWYYGLTDAQLSAVLTQNNARLIDVQKYATASGDRFTAVMVSNTGTQARAWWFYHDVTATQINTALSQNGARITSLKSRYVNGADRFTAIMIKNSGVDAATSYWYPNISVAQLNAELQAKNGRLIDLYRRSSSPSFDAVIVVDPGVQSFWYYDVASTTELGDLMAQRAARPIELQRYIDSSGKTRFATVLLDNADPNTRRVERAFATRLPRGVFGAMAKRVGTAPSAAYNVDYAFDPASALKIVHHAYLFGKDFHAWDYSEEFRYWKNPDGPENKDACPDPAWDVLENRVISDVNDADYQMMQYSNNLITHGFEERYGRDNLNAFMADLGMTKSVLDQSIGCGYTGGHRNYSSIRDLAHVYEAATDGTIVIGPNGEWSGWFFHQLLGGPAPSTGWFADLVRAEAASLGKRPDIADAFIANAVIRQKGGSYNIGLGYDTAYEYVRSSAGRFELPTKSAGVIVPRYVMTGWYITGYTVYCTMKTPDETEEQVNARCPDYKIAGEAMVAAATEAMRAEVRSALATW